MKKTLLAAALTLGFAGVAQAETSVTLYGIIDGGIGYQQVKGNNSYVNGVDNSFKAKRTGMTDGGASGQYGNRWGLKGVEELGDGLRAVFVLESGFDIGTGHQGQSGRLFGRQATLGLAGDSWGQLDIGRQTNITSKYLPGIGDPFGASFGQANMGAAFTSANTLRWDNMIMYQTPNYSGFQLGVGYSFNVDGNQSFKYSGDENTNDHGITAGIRYANGPIGVAVTYDQAKQTRSIYDTTAEAYEDSRATAKSWNLGASYDFEIVKVHAAYGQTRNGLFAKQGYEGLEYGEEGTFTPPGGTAADAVGYVNDFEGHGMKVNSYLLGLSAPIGNGTLMASAHMADPRNASDAFDAAYAGTGYELKKQQTYSLGYVYGLSKRTSVYAIGSYAKNVTFRPDAKAQLVGVGINHKF